VLTAVVGRGPQASRQPEAHVPEISGSIEKEEEMVTKAQVAAYLVKHAPEIAALIEKDQPSVGDVHAPSSLGSGRRRLPKPSDRRQIKARSFNEKISTAYFQNSEEPVETIWSVNVLKVDDDKQQVFGWASISSR
jgi:hypothetical protein